MSPTLPVIDLPVIDLPVIDLAALDHDDLRRATHEVGFFYLVGHGVPQQAMDRVFEVARRFFALPEADKLAVEMLRSPHFRGYTRLGGELTQGRVDWREQIDVAAERDPVPADGRATYWRLEGPNLWPAALPELREVLLDWQDRLSAIGLRLLREWAVCLGAAPDTFDAAFADRPSTLIKLVTFPGRAGDERQGVGAHKDPGVLTLLLVEPGSTGLQVELDDGTWLDAPPRPGAFVVNIGELLEVATDGYLKATTHRVLSPPDGATRLSVPFFLNPALDAAVPRIPLPAELAARVRGVTDDPANPISAVFGENLLKARLRAHPDVARRHHPDLVAR